MSEFTLAKDISITSGFAFSSALFDPEHGEPLIRIRDIQGQKTVVKYTGTYSEEYVVETGDLLVGMDGDFNVVRWLGAKALLNQRVCKIESVSDEVHQGFLFWYLQPKLKEIHAVTPQTTVKHLSVKDIYAIEKPCLNYLEQEMIANILDTLDSQIRETETIIAKLQHVKQGLLHDLLTRGVDENGELRPSYEDAPELYQPSELGWIPKEWDVKTIEELGGFVTSGSRDWAQYYSERGDLFIRIGNLTREHINFRFDKIQYVTPPKLGDGQRTKLVNGDILVSITADLGIVGVISEEIGTAYINQHIAMIRFSNKGVNARFIGHFLGASNFQRLLSAKNDAGAKAGLNLPTVRSFPVLKVNKTEQDEIANRLDSMDKSIEIERVSLNKLKLKKSGLMDDLLTGKVRVTELLKQKQAS